MSDNHPKGLFRNDVKLARPIPIKFEDTSTIKYAIEVEYNNGEKEQLSQPFISAEEAQKQIDEALKSK